MPIVLQGWGSPFAPLGQGYSSGPALPPEPSIILQGMGAPQRLLSEGYSRRRRHPLGKNTSPQPHTDLVQLLLGVLAYQDDPDITQAVLTDYQSTEAEALTLGEAPTTSGRSAGADAYDDGAAEWGFAQYGG